MNRAPRPLLLDGAGLQLFAVFHQPVQPAKGGVLICPPFLHEHSRSYRLFALLGDALASLGIAVLRFDYAGTGDSAGGDTSFSLAGATLDAARAMDALRQRIGAVPITVLGVRAGAFPALSLAATQSLRALWLWQPVVDGAAYLDELRVLDRERARMHDQPAGADAEKAASDENTLMGFPCDAQLLTELAQARIPRTLATAASTTVFGIDEAETVPEGASRFELASEHGNWVGEVDIGHFLAAPVRELAARMATLVRSS